MHEHRTVPAPDKLRWPSVETFRTLVEQHIPRRQNDFIGIPQKVFQHNRPRFGIGARIDMQYRRYDMRVALIDVHQQRRFVPVQPKAVRQVRVQINARPRLVEGVELRQDALRQGRAVDKQGLDAVNDVDEMFVPVVRFVVRVSDGAAQRGDQVVRCAGEAPTRFRKVGLDDCGCDGLHPQIVFFFRGGNERSLVEAAVGERGPSVSVGGVAGESYCLLVRNTSY